MHLDGIPQVLLAPFAALLSLTNCRYIGLESMASILLHLKNRTDAAGSIWESEAVQHNGGRPLHPSVLGLAGQRYRQPGAFVSLTSEHVSKQQGQTRSIYISSSHTRLIRCSTLRRVHLTYASIDILGNANKIILAT